jgi:hypothetical protein
MTFKSGDYVTHNANWSQKEGVVFQLIRENKRYTKKAFHVKMVTPLSSDSEIVKANFNISPKEYTLFTKDLKKI